MPEPTGPKTQDVETDLLTNWSLTRHGRLGSFALLLARVAMLVSLEGVRHAS